MKKWIICLVIGLMTTSFAHAHKTYRWVENGVREVRTEREPYEIEGRYDVKNTGQFSEAPKKKAFDVSTTNGVTSITDRNTGRTVFCTPNLPHKDSYSCR